MKILGTGLSGLVGNQIVTNNPDIEFTDISLDSGYDILKPSSLISLFENFEGDTVLHLAAFTDTNLAFLQRDDTTGLCYQLNVVGTQNVVDLCRQFHKHLIYVSTDFVFDGTKLSPYVETDTPNPIDWYGYTKYQGEIISSSINATIARIAYPYCASSDKKIDIVRKIKTKLENHELVTLFNDQITTPTFIDDLAQAFRILIEKKPSGIYHLVGSSSQSPYDMALMIARTFGYDETLVKPSSLAQYLSNPSNRPFAVNSSLSNTKFSTEFNFHFHTLQEGLNIIKQI